MSDEAPPLAILDVTVAAPAALTVASVLATYGTLAAWMWGPEFRAYGLVAALSAAGSVLLGLLAIGASLAQLIASRRRGLPASALLVAVLALSALLPSPVAFVHVRDARATNTFAPYAVPLTPPWNAMALPLGPGVVLYADGVTVVISYSTNLGHTIPTLTSSYDAAVRAQGWTPTFTTGNATSTTNTYAQNGKNLSLVVMDMAGSVTVSLALM